ncbi:S-layer homology domain-containing protein [Paenibacillus ginsengarvi]|nr:S-layer homology domain-containing protein [Paenibacillus ginsengarvi]
MKNRNRIWRKTISLALALAVGLGGLLPQASSGFAADSPLADAKLADDGLRSLLTELTPESLADAARAAKETSGDAVAGNKSGLTGVTRSVYAPAVPVLDPLPVYSKAPSIVVTGRAEDGTTVTISSRLNNGEPVEEGTTATDASQRFSFELPLTEEGEYRITATAERGGVNSLASEPVTVHADRTPPGRVENETWRLLYPANTSLLLQWSAPTVPNGQGGRMNDPSVIGYRLYDKSGTLLRETVEQQAIFTDLQPARPYTILVRAFDAAGNESSSTGIYAGTSPANEVRLGEPMYDVAPALSGDGSTVLYQAEADSRLYIVDTATGVSSPVNLTDDGQAPNGSIADLAVNRTGTVLAFTSDATNLRAAKPSGGANKGVYIYFAGTGTLELISDPAKKASKPSLNAGGSRIVWAEGSQIYMYDFGNGTKTLVSKAADGAPGDQASESPVISADGKRIAYETSSTNLKGTEDMGSFSSNAVAVYDVAADTHIFFHGYNGLSRSISMSADGKYVVFRATRGGFAKVQAFDLRSEDSRLWSEDEFPDSRPSSERKDKVYEKTSLSGDGRYVVTSLLDHNPSGSIYTNHYTERMDRETGLVDVVGNPGYNTDNAKIDEAGNRIVYVRSDGLYTYCYGECRQKQPDETLGSAEWQAPDSAMTSGSLNPGSDMTILATGQPNKTIVADVAYREILQGDPAQVRNVTKTVAMTETPASSGVYRAAFRVLEGMTQIDSIQARPEGGGASKAVARLPVDVAGKLVIDVAAEHPDLLSGLQFVLQSSGASRTTKPLAAGQTHYELYWRHVDDLELELQDGKSGAVYARQSGLSLGKGGTTTIRLVPVFPASLSVEVLYGSTPVAAELTFKDERGVSLGRIPTNANGIALLDGRLAGENITVAVAPPAEYQTPKETKVRLGIGKTPLQVSLKKWNETIDGYTLDYTRQVGKSSAKVPVIGSEAALTLKAESGHTIRAQISKSVWKGGDAPEADSEWLDLAETAEEPGTYKGTFGITEGTARLEEMTFEINGTPIPRAYPIRTNVAPRLRLTIGVPAASVWSAMLSETQFHLSQYSAAGSFHNEQRAASPETLSYEFDVPFEKTSVWFTLVPSGSSKLVATQQQTMSPGYGQVAEMTFLPKYRYTFNINVKTKTADTPLVKAELRDGANGTVLWESGAYGTVAGMVTMLRGVDASPKPRLTIIPQSPAYEVAAVDFDTELLEQQVEITLTESPEALLRGRVFAPDGTPAGDSIVSAVLTKDGFSRMYTARTDRAGAYSLKLTAGEVELRATRSGGLGGFSPTRKLAIEGDQTVDLTLKEPAKVTLNLYTRLGGGDWEGPIDLDWRTTVHLNVSPSFQVTAQNGREYRTLATTGDTVGFCVNGVEAGLPSKCENTVIGDSNEANIEIRLENSGGQAYFRAIRPDGTPLYGLNATLQQLDDSRADSRYLSYDKDKQSFVVPLRGSGNQRLLLSAPYADAVASVDFAVRPGAVVNLGDIRLQPAGTFSGSGNGIESSSDWSTPGGRITLRAVYKNNARSSYELEPQDAVLAIELPNEAEYVPGTLVQNGKAAEPRLVGRTLEVPIGSVPLYAEGSVRLQLHLREQPGSTDIAIVGKMRYNNPLPHEDILGTAIVGILPVTLRAPEIVADPHFKVNGYAPAGSEVTLYDNGAPIGKAPVSPAGTWTLPVELADSGAKKHRLSTESNLNGVRVPGERAYVEYDPNDPGLSSVSLVQNDGRVVQFDTVNGTAVFPYVVVPGYPVQVDLKFRDAARVEHVFVRVGGSVAEAQLVNGAYRALVPIARGVGPIVVDYTKKRDRVETPGPVPTEEEFRSSLPSTMADYSMEWVAGPGEKTPSGSVMPERAASARFKVNEFLWTQINVSTTSAGTFKPSDGDVRHAGETGLPVYGLTISRKKSDSEITIQISGYVPDNAATAKASAANSGRVRTLGAEQTLAKKTIEFTIGKVGQALGFRDVIAGTMDAFDSDNFMNRVNRAIEQAEQICDPVAREYYLNFAWEVKTDIFAHEQVKLNVGALGTLFGSGLWGIAFWAEGYYIGQKLDEVANDELTELETHLRPYLSELNCVKKKPPKPVADPVYIWDPSGYVYEGLPDNRIEGVTATVLEQDSRTGEWRAWDADWYLQQNPLLTDGQGRYAWDVPPGKWKVRYEKEGYETTYSDELDVPPPQLEVNIPLVSYRPPQVESVKAAAGGGYVDIVFSKPIDTRSLTPDSVTAESADGKPVEGSVQAKQPVEANGLLLATTLRYTPAAPLADGDYKLLISGAIASYAGIPMGSDVQRPFRVTHQDVTPPAAPAHVTAGITFGTATVAWDDPADDDYAKALVRWKKAGDASYSAPIEVARGTGWVQMPGLPEAAGYEFQVSAVDEAGNESAGATANWAVSADRLPPLAVGNLEAQAVQERQVVLGWTDPAAPDLAKLKLTWASSSSPDDKKQGEALPGAQTFTAGELTPNTEYNFSIVAVDRSGNESVAASIAVRTKTAAVTQYEGGGVSGGYGGGPAAEPNPNQTEVKLGPEGGSFRLFDGLAELAVPKDAFAAETKLTLTLKATGTDDRLASRYMRMSGSVEMVSDGAAPVKPLLLAMQLNPALAGEADARRFSLYRSDASTSGGWTYYGGVVDVASRMVEASIDAFGEYAVMMYDRPFADMKAHWSRTSVDVLVSRHMVDGAGEELFEPDRLITRAEMTKLLVEALGQGQGKAPGGEKEAVSAFADVSPDAWYARVVADAVKLGLVEGADNRFRPNDAITREELAVLFSRFAALQGHRLEPASGQEPMNRFADSQAVSAWAKVAVAASVRKGWMQGVTDSELLPHGEASRGQAATMLLRVLTTLGAIEK